MFWLRIAFCALLPNGFWNGMRAGGCICIMEEDEHESLSGLSYIGGINGER